MTTTDVRRLRDALQALEVLNRLRASGGEPDHAPLLRRRLDDIFENFAALEVRTAKQLSGAAWCAKFPGSARTSDLADGFREKVDKFIAAMTAAGAAVDISSTLRPLQRAYLMHWAWQVAKGLTLAKDVPAYAGVDIEWVHATDADSVKGAQAMVTGYGLKHDAALTGKHTEGLAIDMDITWAGDLTIAKADGTSTKITSTPRTGMNTALHVVGATYGVKKATFAGDPPHWSDDGH